MISTTYKRITDLKQYIYHEGFKKYFKNTGWMFFGQLINMLVAFFVGAYIARYLGPHDYGLMNYVVSFVGLFTFLIGFGIDAILNRELIKYPEKKEKLIGNSFWIKIFGALLAITVVNIVSYLIGENNYTKWLILLFSLTFIFQAFGVFSIFFQSQVLARKNVQVQLGVAILSTILKLLLIYLNFNVSWFIGVFVFDSIVSSVAIFFIYFISKHNINWKFDWQISKILLKDSWPLMFTAAATMIYMKIDQTMIKFMLNESAVGIYSVAVKLSEIWYFIPNIICASLFPAIVNAKNTDKNQYNRRLKYLYILMLLLAVLIAIPSFFLAKYIVFYLFGKDYIGAIIPFQIYIWAGIPVFLMAAFTQYLLAENFTKTLFIVTTLGAIINIGLNLILVPRYNIIGASIATLISYFIPILSILFFNKIQKYVFIK